jgi:DNA polymerase-1
MSAATLTATSVFTTVAQAKSVVARYLAREREPVFFDTETTGLDPRTCKLVAVQVKQGERPAVIFDVRDRPEVVKALAPIFEKLTIIGHNLKFDLNFLRAAGIQVHRCYDTQLAEQLLLGMGLSEAKDAGVGVNLEATAKRYGMPVSKDERGWFYTPAPLDQRPEEWAAPFPSEQVAYMAQDVDVLPTIAFEQKAELKRLGLNEVARIEMDCLPALVEMEHTGIRIDVEGWRAFIAEKDIEAKRLENEVLAVIGAAVLSERIRAYDREMKRYEGYREALAREEKRLRVQYDSLNEPTGWGEYKKANMAAWRAKTMPVTKPKLDTSPPNLDSTAQLIVGLEALGVPVPTKKNPKGQRVKTTESKALEPLAARYPVIKLFLDYRKNAKFVTSFGETLLAHADQYGRIHPEYQQIGAATGRMSCQRPNWQQVPSKGDGKRLRELVKAAPGNVLLTADFSNIELRILANITGDETMIRLFNEGADLHSETARRMFKLDASIDPAKVVWKRDLTYRQIAKIINFMLVYGGSPFKLAMEIGIETSEAEALVESYFVAYPGVAAWMRRTKREVWSTLCSKTLAGRRRPYEDVGAEPNIYGYRGKRDEYEDAKREWLKRRSRVERQSLNTPIQGTSADITKLACALFHKHCDVRLGRLVAVVHDEMVVEAKEEHALVVAEVLKTAMKTACDRYLTLSPVPEPDVMVSDHWVKG